MSEKPLPELPTPVGRVHHLHNHLPRIEWFRAPGKVGTRLYTQDQLEEQREACYLAGLQAAKDGASAHCSQEPVKL